MVIVSILNFFSVLFDNLHSFTPKWRGSELIFLTDLTMCKRVIVVTLSLQSFAHDPITSVSINYQGSIPFKFTTILNHSLLDNIWRYILRYYMHSDVISKFNLFLHEMVNSFATGNTLLWRFESAKYNTMCVVHIGNMCSRFSINSEATVKKYQQIAKSNQN